MNISRARSLLDHRKILIALGLALFSFGQLQAQTTYTARSGKIAFRVGSNVPFITVNGSSGAIRGGGTATANEGMATIHDLHFEIDPLTFKTGLKLRDEHLYEKVFTAADGSRPAIVLRAEHFAAKFDPATPKWEGTLQGQLTMRGVTRPATFHVTGEKRGTGTVVNADAVVKTSSFGVKPISNAGVTVRDEVAITVSGLLLQP